MHLSAEPLSSSCLTPSSIWPCCKVHAEGTMGNELNHGKADCWYLRSSVGHVGKVGTEGLGFSMDATPPWIASAPFWEDKTGGTEVAKIT